ncbi:MAG: hypothetical protein JST00_44795 [Deltaproteobacteria bacterium]|nr:hypothetical protein [Deltaproteobacteria bacterium]
MVVRLFRFLGLGAFVVSLAGCSTDPGFPVFQVALAETARDEAFLTKLCKRPIPQAEANAIISVMQGKPASATNEIAFPNFSSKRSVLGKDGTGSTDVTYISKQGPCQGTMTFDFHQDTAAQKVGKRGVKYSSTVDLTNVVVTPK